MRDSWKRATDWNSRWTVIPLHVVVRGGRDGRLRRTVTVQKTQMPGVRLAEVAMTFGRYPLAADRHQPEARRPFEVLGLHQLMPKRGGKIDDRNALSPD